MLNSLHVAQTGLNAARTAVEGVMNNITNENTPGYKKRVVELEESGHIDGSLTGRGVIIGDVKRITNEYVYDNLLSQNGKESYYDQLSTTLADVESIFFETEDSGFASDINRYFQAVESLRSDPTNEINKNNVKDFAKILVENVQTLYEGIEDLTKSGINAIKSDVEIVNGILSDIGSINEKIGQQLVPPNDLLDKRDALEKKLSEYVDVEIDRTEDYELKIGGVTAVRYNTNIHNVSVNEEYIPQRDKFSTDSSDNTVALAVGTFTADDVVTYKLNSTLSASVTFGESVTGDWDNDSSTAQTAVVVSNTNYMEALKHKINNTTDMSNFVTAYNGGTQIDSNGDEVEITPSNEGYLNVKSAVDGEKGSFDGYITISKRTGSTVDSESIIYKDGTSSTESADNIKVQVFDGDVTLKRGSIKAILENADSTDSSNKFNVYKEKLDAFVNTFVDIHNSFISQSDGTYLYGQKNVDSTTTGTEISIGMFSGANVATFAFNESAMTSMNQDKLDYLSTIQWKDDLDFDGTMQDGSSSDSTSIAKFYSSVQVKIASDKENTDYLQDTQSAILNSLQSSYDQLVKVDKDEEMINLIKFQSSYEANAKIITVVDEMLATILGMKR